MNTIEHYLVKRNFQNNLNKRYVLLSEMEVDLQQMKCGCLKTIAVVIKTLYLLYS